MSKEIFRKEMKEALSLISEKDLTAKSYGLSKNLAQLMSSLNVIQNKICIGGFAPIAKEPRWFLDQDHLTAFPVFDQNSGLMIFKMAARKDLVMRKDFGVDIFAPELSSPDAIPGVLLIPGLVFTKQGERLGRGKGFYDKYLAHYHGIKIGICFSEQLKPLIPSEKHDVVMDYIVTENEIINCKRI